MTDLFEKYAAARAKYPEEIEHIEAEEARVKDLLRLKDYASLEVTQALLKLCRTDIIECRRKLATDRSLLADVDTAADLWGLIDARMWFINMVARDIDGELAMIEAGLDAELQK